jgi:hypothetical protein
MTRRLIPFTLASAFIASQAQAQGNTSGDWIMPLLRSSMETKKGVTLHVKGQAISIMVTAIGDQFVEGRNQQYSKFVVRLAAIDAAAIA